jgi:hypothetical protein
MLSVGQIARRFSPTQDIHIKRHTHKSDRWIPAESVMYITDKTSRLEHNWQTSRAVGGVLGQDHVLAVEDEPRHLRVKPRTIYTCEGDP